jgi:Ca2+-binding RTX toxin-like protein
VLQTADQTGTAPINLAGNTQDNLIIGNAGDNILDGGVNTDTTAFNLAGADTLRGLGGNDSYYVDSNDDRIVELAGQGNDVVYARYSYGLTTGASVERLATANAASTEMRDLTGKEFGQRIGGTAGNNRLRGAGGSDLLIGGAGNDRLAGGSGNDRLEGGAGTDTFVFETSGDSRGYAMRSDGAKFMPDAITDFAKGADKIDLSGIDAVPSTAANDAFTFLGTGAFSHQAGQVRYETANGFTSIYADVNGDGGADLTIVMLTPVALTAVDFVL